MAPPEGPTSTALEEAEEVAALPLGVPAGLDLEVRRIAREELWERATPEEDDALGPLLAGSGRADLEACRRIIWSLHQAHRGFLERSGQRSDNVLAWFVLQ
jgi:hypothetical protein